MPDLNNEFFHGKQFADTYDAFKIELASLDTKHKTWFETNTKENDLEVPDSIEKHYVFVHANGKVIFNFLPDSNAPEFIRNDAKEIFKKYFAPKK